MNSTTMSTHLRTAWTIIVLIALLAVLRFLIACNSLKETAHDVVGDVVDCTVAHSKEVTEQFGPLVDAALRAATQPDGSIDWTPIRDATKNFTLKTGGCVLAASIARALAPRVDDPTSPRVSPLEADQMALRSGFDALRRERFGGVHFKTELGTL